MPSTVPNSPSSGLRVPITSSAGKRDRSSDSLAIDIRSISSLMTASSGQILHSEFDDVVSECLLTKLRNGRCMVMFNPSLDCRLEVDVVVGSRLY